MSQADKKLWKIALAGGLIFALLLFVWPSPDSDAPTVAPSSARLTAANAELAGWGEGRWSASRVQWDDTLRRVEMYVTAGATANDVAIDGYCRVMADIAAEQLPGYRVAAEVRRGSDTVKCR